MTAPDSGEMGPATVSDAVLSEDGLYRYSLTRSWNGGYGPEVLWVMLNPSTADADVDDPTIRRCMAFSKAWGFGRLRVVNLFALRATDPKVLAKPPCDPIGPYNNDHIRYAVEDADLIVAAWGTKGTIRCRGSRVTDHLTVRDRRDVMCLDTTKDGHPKHPLYVRGDTEPVLYRPALATLSGRSQP